MNSVFSVFDPVLIIISPLLEVQKLIVFFFLVLQAFIFTVKNIFAAWTDPEG